MRPIEEAREKARQKARLEAEQMRMAPEKILLFIIVMVAALFISVFAKNK